MMNDTAQSHQPHQHEQNADRSFAFMTSLAASGPWPTWPLQTHKEIKQQENNQIPHELQWPSVPLPPPPPPPRQASPHPNDSNSMVLAIPKRACTASPSPCPSPSPNPCLNSTLSYNFPATPASTATYSTPSSSTNSNRRPRPPSLNIPPLCLGGLNSSDSPTVASSNSATSSASNSLDCASADGAPALPLLMEALDPQLWPFAQLSASNLATSISTDCSSYSSPSNNSINSLQSINSSFGLFDTVQSSNQTNNSHSLSSPNSSFPASPHLNLSLADNNNGSMTNLSSMALSMAVTQALQQIPPTAIIAAMPPTFSSNSICANSAISSSPTLSTSSSSSSSSSPSSAALSYRMVVTEASEAASPSSSSANTSSTNEFDVVTMSQNREAAAAFLRSLPFPTPKRRSTIHTCSPQPLQQPQRSAKAAKTASGALTDRGRNTQNRENTLQMPVVTQSWQQHTAQQMLPQQSQQHNCPPSNIGDGCKWSAPPAASTARTSFAINSAATNAEAASLACSNENGNGSRLHHWLVSHSKRMKHTVAGEPPLA